MNKKEAIEIVLSELKRRFPKSKQEGFMPDQEVLDAIKFLEESNDTNR
jgi:hypothetical protein